jgi:LysM repeat protein
MKRLMFAMLIAVVLASALAAPAAASGSAQTVTYVVKPDDTLSSIARQFCTTWQQIYHINRAVIGPNPNVLRSGTVLHVPNQCGGQTPQPLPPAPCNLGPIPHAMGPLNGNIYTVVLGDTLFSISRRFCTSVEHLAASNGIRHPWRIYAGQRLVVPVPTQPTPTPQPQRFLSITSPLPNQVVNLTFTATGAGAGLFEGNVVVTAFTNAGAQLAQQATTLQGANVGTGGAGTWTVSLTVNVPPGTPGYIEASSPQSNVAPARVNVVYGQQPAGPTLTITSPSPNITLPRVFNVIGTASGAQQGFVVVQALSRDGIVLFAEASVVVPGGSGTWNVTLTVPVSAVTDGQITALWSQNTAVRANILVRFSGS